MANGLKLLSLFIVVSQCQISESSEISFASLLFSAFACCCQKDVSLKQSTHQLPQATFTSIFYEVFCIYISLIFHIVWKKVLPSHFSPHIFVHRIWMSLHLLSNCFLNESCSFLSFVEFITTRYILLLE